MKKLDSTNSLRVYIKPTIKTRKINAPQIMAISSGGEGNGTPAGAKGFFDYGDTGNDSQY